MPGIHDGHVHPLAGGLALTKPTLNYRKLDLQEFLKALRRFLARSADQEPDGWLSVDLWEPAGMDRQPTKKDLDSLPTRRPIIVIDLSGHTAVANSRALEFAGITASTHDPQGGKIKRGRRGEPSGVLLDDAIGLVTAEDPAAHHRAESGCPGSRPQGDGRAGNHVLPRRGGRQDGAGCPRRTLRPGTADCQAVRGDHGFSRCRGRAGEAAGPARALRATYGRAGITIRTVKMFFDGVIEHPSQTAALLEPYRVNKGTKRDPRWVPGKSRGPTYFRQPVANRAIAALDAAGWQVHVHAIGDRAVRSALDAFENARSVAATPTTATRSRTSS